MKPFVMNDLYDDQIQTLEELQRKISQIPDDIVLPSNRDLSCHILARALARFSYPVKLEVVDGWYADMFPHSWLRQGHMGVYDPYPVGVLLANQSRVVFTRIEVAQHTYIDIPTKRNRNLSIYQETRDEMFKPEFVMSPVFDLKDIDRDVDFVCRFIESQPHQPGRHL